MAKEKDNPSIAQAVAVIAENVKTQTRILDRMESRQFDAFKTLSTLSAVNSEEHSGIRETLKNYFKLIIALISLVAGFVGAKVLIG